ncbi:sulfotransferase 1B1-like isoform X1 [Macrobrachium nipponense]|uniref:sulfotransferase 1B1-like isoform X1 n=1 Tax=Macrobrachium nipponense TaxID=159736 RepID=UPI0030C8C78B
MSLYRLIVNARSCFQSPSRIWTLKGQNVWIRRPLSSSSNGQYPAMRKFRIYKRIFALTLFSGTLGLAWYLKRQKGIRLKNLLEDCTRLPVDETLFGADVSLYKCKGYVFAGQLIMSGVLKELPDFQFRPDDIIVASYPKTGTTWIQEIVYMLTHNFKRSDASSEVLETRFPYLEYPYPGIKSVASKAGRRFIKTHLPYSLLPPSFESSNAKLVYITRNPRDTAISYFHFMRLLTPCSFQGTLSDFIRMFLSDTVMYSPFFDHVLEYWNRREVSNILFITYEDLKKRPIHVIQRVAKFLEIEASDADILYVAACTSFDAMSENPSVNYEHWKDLGFAHKEEGKFMRKGKVGDWKARLTKMEISAFEEWEKRNLSNSDFCFTYEISDADVES